MEDGHDDIQVDDDVSCVLMIDLPSSGLLPKPVREHDTQSFTSTYP